MFNRYEKRIKFNNNIILTKMKHSMIWKNSMCILDTI